MEFIKEAKNHGADFIFGGGDLADKNGPIYSPAILKKFLAPRFKKIIEFSHSLGLYYVFRSDGNTRPLWDLLFSEIKFDNYGEIEKSVGIELKELKDKYGEKINLIGNVDCAKTLVYGSKEEIYKEVKNCIEDASKEGGYILSSSNSIHYNVPSKNFIYMVEAGENTRNIKKLLISLSSYFFLVFFSSNNFILNNFNSPSSGIYNTFTLSPTLKFFIASCISGVVAFKIIVVPSSCFIVIVNKFVSMFVISPTTFSTFTFAPFGVSFSLEDAFFSPAKRIRQKHKIIPANKIKFFFIYTPPFLSLQKRKHTS
ncbi:MAG: hypothetical protein NC915_00425 [Candidatus Omnitrophica bacterium]|nr:hypothetical protein [Candidatus Omnitrophota bacterium]